ncbi:twin-arginine translocase subunit TatB [Sinimarinibacterium sp. CAU 1509]|uniref:Sec-independent protein translocase protein TatB n=1 Tax=Sinimarinibacterium sp. CAU 1509 TaxID=2562283 RepID=UPI0010AC5B7B|nr:Sec-independent protein translocase protein TatB [Sinimarinibacterium sp. CAU 1509]TJY58264.1 twin-arginine translocase subunit TatB [Sinimarinibacterium sp. CAU 1509]
MFDIGFSELLICFIIALVVLGPEKMPGLARTIGRWTGQARGYLRNLTAELDREAKLADLKQQLEDAKRAVRGETQSLQDTVKNVVADVQKAAPSKATEPSTPAQSPPTPPSPPPEA